MKIDFNCEQCGQAFSVDAIHAGKKANCRCGASLTVPNAAPQVASSNPGTSATGLHVDIVKVEYGDPDDDNDASCNFTLSVRNTTDTEIEFLHIKAIFSDSAGNVIVESENEEETIISPGETETVQTYGPWINLSLLGDLGTASCSVTVHGCYSSYTKLPSLPLSVGPNNVQGMSCDVVLDGILKIQRLSGWVGKPDEENDARVTVNAHVLNVTDEYIPRLQIKAEVLGGNGRPIEDSSSENPIKGNCESLVETSFWGVNPKRLQDASVALEALMYRHIATGTQTKSGFTKQVWD